MNFLKNLFKIPTKFGVTLISSNFNYKQGMYSLDFQDDHLAIQVFNTPVADVIELKDIESIGYNKLNLTQSTDKNFYIELKLKDGKQMTFDVFPLAENFAKINVIEMQKRINNLNPSTSPFKQIAL